MAEVIGGCTPYAALSTAAVIAAAIKAKPGQVYGIAVCNNGANEMFLRLYDKASAPATTDTPVYRMMIPGNAAGTVTSVVIPDGLFFPTGIGIRVSGAVADDDNTNLAANEVMVNVFFK